jgi:beta-xylosidase
MIPYRLNYMRKEFLIIVFFINVLAEATMAQTHSKSQEKVYTNPLKVQFGDPFVLFTDGTYYMYGTGGGADRGFSAYSSKDLVNWKPEGQVYFHDNKNGWSDPNAAWGGAYWAPEVYKVEDKFYLFYSAQWKVNPAKEAENFKVGVAVSDKPTGPFVDLSPKPLFDPGYPIIDANVFFDTNGRSYLYYSRAAYKHPVESEIADEARKSGKYKEIEESWVYGVELKPDFSGVTGQPVLVLRPPIKLNDKQAAWESLSVTTGEVNRRWTEGSVTFKKDGIYYIMYSANHFGGEHYAVGYATSSSPLGPFKKAENNPVLHKNTDAGGTVSGTGHNSITYSPDGKEMFCVYHGRTVATGSERVVFIDRMKVTNGKITVYGPTTQPQKKPTVSP